jgi:hypothetical protein
MEDLNPRREGRGTPERREGADIRVADFAGAKPVPGLDRHSTDHIGERLREYYVALAQEPLPPRIAALLERLDEPSAEA